LRLFLEEYFQKRGHDSIVQEENDVGNLIVHPEASVWIITHMDTVSIKREYEFDGTYAYGTGVCDPKGGIAAILHALNKIKRLNLGLAFLADEEEGGKGSELFIREFFPETAIVIEPTSLKIADRHYGNLEILIKVRGEPSHGSKPEYGDNAIERAFELFKELKQIQNLSVIEIEGGGKEYTIPETCKMRIDFLLSPNTDLNKLKDSILPVLEKYGDYEILEESEGFTSKKFFILEDAIVRAGIDLSYTEMLSWTDAINLKKAGCEVVVWGPGELRYCHTRNERIKIEEIMKASDVIVNLNGIV